MAVEPVMAILIGGVFSAIEQEVRFHIEFPGIFESLKAEHRLMQIFVEDSAADQHQMLRREEWIRELRKQSNTAEDLIDTVSLGLESATNKRGITAVEHRIKHFLIKRNMTRQIDRFKAKLHEIHQLAIVPNSASENERIAKQVPSQDLSEIIGHESAKQRDKLLNQLTLEGRQRTVFTIVGMGGIGKSTLAWMAFNHSTANSTYAIRAWVSISRRYNYRDLQVNIMSDINNWFTLSLGDFLGYVKDKRYLLVLDDLWDSPPTHILNAVPDEHNGSRIVITTRMNDVALYAGPQTHLFKMKHMDDSTSWELFRKRALPDKYDRVFESIGKRILTRCGGLPLSIVSMADKFKNLNSSPTEPPRRVDWENTFNKMEHNVLQEEVLNKLQQSYYDLTPKLQSCFLRIAFFPFNHPILARKLILLWVAEGLIKDQEGESIDVTAETYLDSLVEKNMVQPIELGPDGKVKACRIDISLHVLSIMKAKEEIYLVIQKGDKFKPSTYTRHQAIHHNSYSYFNPQIKVTSQLRSVMFIVPNGRISLSQLKIMCKKFKLLKLLHLEDMIVGHLPDEIGNLKNLRYLNLRNTSIDKLQPSMSNLKKLLTFDLRDNMYVTGLNVIKDMTSLQNLYLPGSYEGLKSLKGLCQLRKMKWVRLHSIELMESLETLTALRKLWIRLEGQVTLDECLKSVQKLKNLESLHLYPDIEISSLDIDKFNSLTSLTKLYIKGGVRRLPRLNEFPPNLMQLTLDGSGLIPFPMDILEELPKLSTLKLRNLYIKGEKLSFLSGKFLRLKYLELLHLWNLQEIELQGEGALPRLKHLTISNCIALNSLPHIPKLSELHIDKMKEAFEKKFQEGGDFWERVRHVHPNFTNTLKSFEEI